MSAVSIVSRRGRWNTLPWRKQVKSSRCGMWCKMCSPYYQWSRCIDVLWSQCYSIQTYYVIPENHAVIFDPVDLKQRYLLWVLDPWFLSKQVKLSFSGVVHLLYLCHVIMETSLSTTTMPASFLTGRLSTKCGNFSSDQTEWLLICLRSLYQKSEHWTYQYYVGICVIWRFAIRG